MSIRYGILMNGSLHNNEHGNTFLSYSKDLVLRKISYNKRSLGRDWESAHLVTIECECEEDEWNEW